MAEESLAFLEQARKGAIPAGDGLRECRRVMLHEVMEAEVGSRWRGAV